MPFIGGNIVLNKIEEKEDYLILFTNKNEPIYIDIEDYDKVKNTTWYKNKDGYIVGVINGKQIKIHRLIMGFPDDLYVDHKHGESSRFDNRKSNLRIASPRENAINRPVRADNNSGCTGVSFDKDKHKWRAEIWLPERKHLGYFVNLEDAIQARKEAEKEYFGEWSYDNSQKE